MRQARPGTVFAHRIKRDAHRPPLSCNIIGIGNTSSWLLPMATNQNYSNLLPRRT